MTTSPDRYADLMPEHDDPALARLVDELDRTLHAVPPPPHLRATMRRVLDQRIAAHPGQGLLSRKEVIKAGAAAAATAWLSVLGHSSLALADELARLVREGPMSAVRLGAMLREERAQWQALLSEIGPDRMDMVDVEGTWSVKQIVAHLTWYEGVVVEGAQKLMKTGTFVREGLRALPLDERNALIAAQSAPRPVREVLAESERVFDQLLSVVAACPDDILNDPRRLGLPDDVVPWTLVANNSYAHYREHMQAIQTWLDASSTYRSGTAGLPGP